MATLHYKTDEEIEIIRESGKILGKAHAEVAKLVKPGIPTIELDRVAYQFILDNGGTPSFKGFHGFPYTLCISVNENVVHGFPSNYELKEGDIISIDCGVKWNGFHSDSAYTYGVGNVKPEVQKLLDYTKQSLYLGIEQAVVGNRIGDIGYAVQTYVEKEGFSVVRELVGHGLGKTLHEKPEVPNYGNKGKGLKLENNLVIAIEPMINLGKKSVIQEKDGWTIRTVDRMPSAHFEHTVAVKKGKADILTTFEYIEEVLNKN
ncbi:MAG: type I methionyl aminopeptidase [Cytophagaceae bacterium]